MIYIYQACKKLDRPIENLLVILLNQLFHINHPWYKINSLRIDPKFKLTLKITLQEWNIFGHVHLQPPYKKLKNAGPNLFIQGVIKSEEEN